MSEINFVVGFMFILSLIRGVVRWVRLRGDARAVEISREHRKHLIESGQIMDDQP